MAASTRTSAMTFWTRCRTRSSRTAATKGLLRRNQYGFNVGGPFFIPGLTHGKSNTYFSLSYEGVHERIARTSLRTIPTMAERTGDYLARGGSGRQSAHHLRSEQHAAQSKFQSVAAGFARQPPISARSVSGQQDSRRTAESRRADRADAVSGAQRRHRPVFSEQLFRQFARDQYRQRHDRQSGPLDRRSPTDQHGAGFLERTAGFSAGVPDHREPRLSQSEFFLAPRIRGTRLHHLGPDREHRDARSEQHHHSRAGEDQPSVPVYQFDPYVGMGRGYPSSTSANNTYAFTNGLSTRFRQHSVRWWRAYVQVSGQ